MEFKSIIITNTKYTDIIRLNDIVFCRASGSYTEIILKNSQTIVASKNLHWIEEKCCSSSFCRIHKSFLVNLIYVNKVFHFDDLLLLSNGVKLPISKSKKNQFWEKLNQIFEQVL